MLGDIERTLRAAIDRCFTAEDLYGALDPEDERRVEGAQSLTLGEVQHLLEDEASFGRLSWLAARKVVISELDRARSTQNDIMHFSPDPLDRNDVEQLGNFASWIAQLEAEAAQVGPRPDETS